MGGGTAGDDGTKIPPDVKAGDRILLGTYSGSDVKVEADEY